MKVETVKIETLVGDERNARRHDAKNLAAVRHSLLEHGQVEPLVVQKSTRRILGGNARALEAKNLGWQTVDVVFVDCDDQTANRLALRLNRTAELATWDDNALSALLRDVGSPIDLGWDPNDLDALLKFGAPTVSDDFLNGISPPLPPTAPTDPPTTDPPTVQRNDDGLVDFVVMLTVQERVEVQRISTAVKRQIGVNTTREVLLAIFRHYPVPPEAA